MYSYIHTEHTTEPATRHECLPPCVILTLPAIYRKKVLRDYSNYATHVCFLDTRVRLYIKQTLSILVKKIILQIAINKLFTPIASIFLRY